MDALMLQAQSVVLWVQASTECHEGVRTGKEYEKGYMSWRHASQTPWRVLHVVLRLVAAREYQGVNYTGGAKK